MYSDFYRQLHNTLANAENETEVRDRFCNAVYSAFGITLRLERGRSDARRNRVILEFKDKGLFHGIATSAKFREAYSQLVDKYIPNQAQSDGRPVSEYVGIAIDGEHFAFVFFEEDGTHRHTALIPIDPDGLTPLLHAIRTDERRAFSLENVLEDFASDSEVATQVIRILWHHLSDSLDNHSQDRQKITMLFQEWQKLFAQAADLGRADRSRVDEYLLGLGMSRPLNYSRALFVLHTYNAILFKLMAPELVTTLRFERHSGFAARVASLSDDELETWPESGLLTASSAV